MKKPETCAPSCYEVAPDVWIHRPWDGCATRYEPSPALPKRSGCWHCQDTGTCSCIVCLEGRPPEQELGPCSVCKKQK